MALHMDIKDHGIRVGTRVRCIYCNKEMAGNFRLKYHLGNVRKDVTPCERVPSAVKEAYRKIVEAEMGNSRKRARIEGSSSRNVSPPENENIDAETDIQDLVSNKVQKSIARFFYENYVDFSAMDSPSFKEMMNVCGGHMGLKIEDLNGWMLQEAFKEVQDCIKKVKDSWSTTGCSILLDAWVDQKGHDLVAFVADSPAGPVYLKSFHVSDIKHDDNALLSLVNGVVEEVGVHNVTQIIADSTSGWVDELGKLFVAGHNRPQVFWSASVSHCFEILLEKIGKLHPFEDILDKCNNIWEFINNNPLVLKVFRDHSHGKIITVSSSEFEFVTSYLTLETIYKAKEILTAMFASSDWNKEEEGIAISNLVDDSSFWESVDRVMKCTSLIRGLLWSSSANNHHVGCIYENLKDVKKNIEWSFDQEKQFCKPLLDVIEDVWKKHLQSPLHTAGYYLNPTVFYSNEFHLDQEVSVGITSSLVHMVESFHIRVQISKQLNNYTRGRDAFNEAHQADQISGISPAEWWAQKASQYPELQSFAIKILSQTCEGASRYKLKRSLAEKLLLTQGMSHCEKEHLEKFAFVHYNLHLQSCKAKPSEKQ